MRALRTYSVKRYLLYAAALFSLGILLSIASTFYFANKAANQVQALQFDQADLRNKQIKDISRTLKYLDFSISNPFIAFTSLVATTPQTFLPASRTVDAASNFTSSLSEILAKQSNKSLPELAPELSDAMPDLNKALLSLSQIRIGGLFGSLDTRLAPVRQDAQRVLQSTTAITPLLEIAPKLAGYSEPRKYLIAFQNSAEARGTGGILGAYAVMSVDKGKVTFSAFGSNAGLTQLNDTPIMMPDEFVRTYNDDPGIWQNSNISPHFPYGAQIWLALWKNQFREDLDGVLTFDPASLSYLLKATSPVQVQGQEITAENVVKVTLSDLYQLYQFDNNARKLFLIDIIKEVSAKIESKNFSTPDLISQLIYPLNQHRILLYSTKAAEQKVIERSQISGAITQKPDNQYRLVIQNTSGNKMDYYLKRSLTLETLSCEGKPKTKVAFTLTNTAPADTKLPAYVVGRLDLNRSNGVKNSYGTRAIIMPPVDTYLISTKDLTTNKKFGFLVTERGHKGVGVQVDLAAGQSQSFELVFKGGTGPLASHQQPLVIDQKDTIIDRCTP